MGKRVLTRLAAAVTSAGLTAVAVWWLHGNAVLNPPTLAERQEARIFNADDAQFFGEQPAFNIEFALRARGEDGDGPYADIAVDGDPRRLRIGETVYPPCVRLSALPDSAALIDICGSYHLLWRRSEEGQSADAMPAAARLSVDPARLSGIEGDDGAEVLDYRQDPSATTLLRDYRERLYRRPLSLRGKVDIQVGEQTDGRRAYYLWPGDDASVFDQLPLEGGDQIVAVNGIALSSAQSLTELYQRLDEAKHLTVTLRRDDRDLVVLLGL